MYESEYLTKCLVSVNCNNFGQWDILQPVKIMITKAKSAYVLEQGQADFFSQSQRANILAFAAHAISVTATQLRCCGLKGAVNNMETEGRGSVMTKLYLQKQALAHGLSLLTPWCGAFCEKKQRDTKSHIQGAYDLATHTGERVRTTNGLIVVRVWRTILQF